MHEEDEEVTHIDNPEEFLLHENFRIGNTTFPNRLKEDSSVDQGSLNDVLSEHAQKFAWYATAYELALYHEAQLKEELQRTYARVDHKVRMEGKDAGVKLTEKMVENTVITHPHYMSLQDKYLAAKRDSGLLKAARDTMIHRRDMLIQMGANYRAEGTSDITLKEEYVKSKTRK